ncbi:RNA polymerase sigma factor FliA [Pseudoxanthomonas winnipegensis]|uniref:RNA polymerase sigma factor FliA n=1 Tax=Pseudoxanthomonas winnipegensis TaxID=2480810 RepID=A0A4Q8LGQ5_9GAMM|nr:RNA polymerase sigma factor FliA [Pseudoxanthomonas winnipegensis]TAA28647.1 RNA polymerase sigma factor FliA [Pseudoxanthomonas winnipegensis]
MNLMATAQYRAHQQGSPAEIVERHGELVRRIAHHLAARLPASVEIDDLVQAGMLGLIDAARNYQNDQGATFETYASIRIRGAMIDEMRRGDWTPRSVHRSYREMVSAVRQVEQATGRAATAAQVAAAMQIPLDEYHHLVEDAARGQITSLDAHIDEHDGEARLASADGATPARAFEQGAFRDALAEAIAGLPEREALVLSLYYEQELNLREIGAVLSVSESRVCQIHGQAVIRLRARLGEWKREPAEID